MTLRFSILIFLLISLNGKSQDKFDEKGSEFGVIITCVTDSTAFLNSDTIVLDLAERDQNVNCPNRPKSSSCCMPWPSMIYLDFVKGNIELGTNKEVTLDSLGFVKKLSHFPRWGKFKYFKKSDTMKITFKQYNWVNTFKVLYRKKDRMLTLIKIKT